MEDLRLGWSISILSVGDFSLFVWKTDAGFKVYYGIKFFISGFMETLCDELALAEKKD